MAREGGAPVGMPAWSLGTWPRETGAEVMLGAWPGAGGSRRRGWVPWGWSAALGWDLSFGCWAPHAWVPSRVTREGAVSSLQGLCVGGCPAAGPLGLPLKPGHPARGGSGLCVSEQGVPTFLGARPHLVPVQSDELIEAFPALPWGDVGRRSQYTGGGNGVLSLTVGGWGFLELGRQTAAGGGTEPCMPDTWLPVRSGHLGLWPSLPAGACANLTPAGTRLRA